MKLEIREDVQCFRSDRNRRSSQHSSAKKNSNTKRNQLLRMPPLAKMAFILFGLILVTLALYKVSDHMKFGVAVGHINEVCASYVNGQTSGQFCAKLCSKDAVINKFLSFNQDKTVVEMQISSRVYIVKFQKTNANENDSTEELYRNNEFNIFSQFNQSNWISLFHGSCGGIYAIDPASYIAGNIFGSADDLFDMLNFPETLDVFMLYGDPDGNSSSLLSFVIEKLRPIKDAIDRLSYQIFFQAYSPSFSQRIEFIKELLLFLERFTISTEGQFLMCDAHINNFGLSSNRTVTIIDADHIFPITTVKEILSNKTCFSNEECRIADNNDCHSACDQNLQKCMPIVAHTNLKNLCNVIRSIVMAPMSREELSTVQLLYKRIAECPHSYSKSSEDEINRIRMILQSIKE